eukprot:gnl/TRDRNA2_/TRDRNA2_160922_c0_seq1.p1 gnl/TRDRNA2_/TRDRNA2_160922_c0~~gnl/TRDRNA2_/TRDRNA2_160922_c0_seq1.p1  ORF type:complete len:187 (+),score=25.00 gnl/TRDRNA2_/TRDRNA2_160922_c0_seq1:39-599(+)
MADLTLADSPHGSYGHNWGLGAARCLSISCDLSQKDNVFRLVPMPDSFVCPLSMDTMEDPVLIGDGCVYERKCIDDWIKRRKQQHLPVTSPSTGLEVPNPVRMISLAALSKAIEAFLSHRHELRDIIERLQAALTQVRSFQDEFNRLRPKADEVESLREENKVLRKELDAWEKGGQAQSTTSTSSG